MTPLHANPTGLAPSLPDMIAVLVLDDLRFDRHKLDRLCSKLPMKCEVAQADCLSSLNLQLDSAAFDLIFVDYDLPDGSGLDALEMIRLSPRNSNAISIMVTGIDEAKIVFEAMSRGCADYITKDELSPSSFERAVINALQKAVLNTQAPTQTYARKDIETALNSFATQCISDIKPMVSRMIRQLRKLRETPDDNIPLQHQRREAVEASCQHLCEFLEHLEIQHADTTLKDLLENNAMNSVPPVGEHAAAPGSQRHKRPPRGSRSPFSKRPPSPFSRPTQ